MSLGSKSPPTEELLQLMSSLSSQSESRLLCLFLLEASSSLGSVNLAFSYL